MKRIFLILSLLIMLMANDVYAKGKTQSSVANRPIQKELTQYFFVRPGDYGAGIQSASEIARLLKAVGFTARTFNRPDYMDDMEDFKTLEATRKSASGTTKVTLVDGEDVLCTIKFADKTDLTKFVDSMVKSGYKRNGTLYSHPKNNLSKVYVRVAGLTVKIIYPSEMLPNNF